MTYSSASQLLNDVFGELARRIFPKDIADDFSLFLIDPDAFIDYLIPVWNCAAAE